MGIDVWVVLDSRPLSVSANGRYLIDRTGNPIFLSGFHTWATVQDGGASDPPPTFDWTAYLAAVQSYGCNFTKLWAMETGRGWSDNSGYWFSPSRYVRTGPGNDNDGKLKVDLTQVNSDYLDRLYNRALACQNAGIYAVVQLFQGWQIENKGWAGAPWSYHPYELANNINSVDGDQDNNGQGTETHYNGSSNVVKSYQTALIEAIVDRVNGLGNIIYEVSNEDTASTENNNWQNYIIDYVHTYEASKPKQHLVLMTWQYPTGSNATLEASHADLICYGSNDGSLLNDPPTPSGKCHMFDTDHICGLTDTYKWIWYSFCRGNAGAWYMDTWDGNYGSDTRNVAANILIRQNLGYLLTLARRCDLLNMSAQPALSSSGWCLAKDHATAAHYVCFYDGAGTFTLNLTTATGTLNVDWLKCADGSTSTETVAGGATRTLTPPWTGAVVAYVRH